MAGSRGVIGEALDKAELASTQIAYVGITNQRETTVVCERRP
jgi:glycerol kinase